jgi:hypothetical protein
VSPEAWQRNRVAVRQRRRGLSSSTGVTLVELLIAACVTWVALCGAWAWLWSAGDTAGAAADRAQAATAAAYAVRCVSNELDLATSLNLPPAGVSPDRALSLEHRHGGAAQETVLIAWDPARRVLWRKAPGTYLADHVELFSVDYFHSDGGRLEAAELAEARWPQSVALVTVTVAVNVGGRSVRANATSAVVPSTT